METKDLKAFSFVFDVCSVWALGQIKKKINPKAMRKSMLCLKQNVFPGKESYMASLPYQVNDSNPEHFLFSFDDNGIEPTALCIPGKGSTTELFL